MNKLTLASWAAGWHRLKALVLDSLSSPINASGRLSDPSGTTFVTTRAAIRQVLTEMVPQDAVSRGTGAARGLANISTERRHLPQADFGTTWRFRPPGTRIRRNDRHTHETRLRQPGGVLRLLPAACRRTYAQSSDATAVRARDNYAFSTSLRRVAAGVTLTRRMTMSNSDRQHCMRKTGPRSPLPGGEGEDRRYSSARRSCGWPRRPSPHPPTFARSGVQTPSLNSKPGRARRVWSR